MHAWRDPAVWRRIQANGMARHFGWEESASHYLEVYQRAIALARPDARQAFSGSAQR